MRPLRVLTWHTHGSYLWYLSQCPVEFYLPVANGRPRHDGRGETFPFGENVHDVPAEEVQFHDFDCILYQCRRNYLEDRFRILSETQRRLPSIYLEHDPPQDYSGNTTHCVDDPNMLLIHVTCFNQLMWDCGATPTRVIEHGVLPSDAKYTGEIPQGIVVINRLKQRGRRAGVDVFERVRKCVPLELVGVGAKELGGIGTIPPQQLGKFISRYRFLFSPGRQTGLGLSICEAMSIGMPIVGLATSELVTVVENGVSGYLDTDVDRLAEYMLRLLDQPAFARRLGEGARRRAAERFDVQLFVDEWEQTFREVTSFAGRDEPRSEASRERSIAAAQT